MKAARKQRSPADREESKRLVNSFARIAEDWGASIDEQLALLGNPARSTYFKWKREGGILPRDTQDRISYVMGIYKALHIIFSDEEIADSWLRKPNTASILGGHSALDLMTSGAMVDLHKVRGFLDAQRGGWS
jgi:hypothetical protein